jgi:hypothetical protein
MRRCWTGGWPTRRWRRCSSSLRAGWASPPQTTAPSPLPPTAPPPSTDWEPAPPTALRPSIGQEATPHGGSLPTRRLRAARSLPPMRVQLAAMQPPRSACTTRHQESPRRRGWQRVNEQAPGEANTPSSASDVQPPLARHAARRARNESILGGGAGTCSQRFSLLGCVSCGCWGHRSASDPKGPWACCRGQQGLGQRGACPEPSVVMP